MRANRLKACEVLELFILRPRQTRRPHRVARSLAPRRLVEPADPGPAEVEVTAATFALSQSITGGVPVLALIE